VQGVLHWAIAVENHGILERLCRGRSDKCQEEILNARATHVERLAREVKESSSISMLWNYSTAKFRGAYSE
jgi:hypothetical protein